MNVTTSQFATPINNDTDCQERKGWYARVTYNCGNSDSSNCGDDTPFILPEIEETCRYEFLYTWQQEQKTERTKTGINSSYYKDYFSAPFKSDLVSATPYASANGRSCSLNIIKNNLNIVKNWNQQYSNVFYISLTPDLRPVTDFYFGTFQLTEINYKPYPYYDKYSIKGYWGIGQLPLGQNKFYWVTRNYTEGEYSYSVVNVAPWQNVYTVLSDTFATKKVLPFINQVFKICRTKIGNITYCTIDELDLNNPDNNPCKNPITSKDTVTDLYSLDDEYRKHNWSYKGTNLISWDNGEFNIPDKPSCTISNVELLFCGCGKCEKKCGDCCVDCVSVANLLRAKMNKEI